MSKNKILSPLKAIRAYCIWCCGKQASEVKKCTRTKCPFYRYRMGKKGGKGSLIKVIKKDVWVVVRELLKLSENANLKNVSYTTIGTAKVQRIKDYGQKDVLRVVLQKRGLPPCKKLNRNNVYKDTKKC